MPNKGPRPNILKKTKGYRDIFAPDNRRKMPLIMVDCTSVMWPPGWSKEDVERWRKSNNLTKPN
jgi:hypothetical protein